MGIYIRIFGELAPHCGCRNAIVDVGLFKVSWLLALQGNRKKGSNGGLKRR